MKLQDTQQREFVIKLNPDYCGRCTICSSVCPFETISKDPKTNEIILDIEKCQVCGVCYSSCPAGAIESVHYDFGSFVRYLESSMKRQKSKVLVVTCRGSTPGIDEIQNAVGVSDFILLCLPCVGRIPGEFYLKAISIGIERIVVISCKEDYCPFEGGSRINLRRVYMLQSLLRVLGYGPETLTLLKAEGSIAYVDPEGCIGCRLCEIICPYDSIETEKYGEKNVAKVKAQLCRGCGICMASCPERAISMTYYTDERLTTQIKSAVKAMV
jgi:MinD superfamily P-loop ATPase